MNDPFKEFREINIPLDNLKDQVNVATNIQRNFSSQIDMALLKSEIYAPYGKMIESIQTMSNSLMQTQSATIKSAFESINFASKVINEYPLSAINQLDEITKMSFAPSLSFQYSSIISEMLKVPRYKVAASLDSIENDLIANASNEYSLDSTRFDRALPITRKATEALLFGEVITLINSSMMFFTDHLMLIATYFCLAIFLEGIEEERKHNKNN